ncbi:MAG: response regulator [Flavobacterium sp.]|nr:MAG: response regulator [Flavobacterium sp.]
MNKKGPILIIDDDKDDREILSEALKKLGYQNAVKFFVDGQEALNYLLDSREVAFLILSDINMPRLSGLELREIIQRNEELRMKSIPFVFFTTSATRKSVWDAYQLSVQGFFIKPISFKDLQVTLKKVIDYWADCKSPNDYL